MTDQITTRDELLAAYSEWLGDTLFSDKYGRLTALFEASANRRLRTREQETTATLTMVQGVATLPTDYLEYKRVTRNSNVPQDLDYIKPSLLAVIYPVTSQIITPPMYQVPRGFFTIEAGQVKVRPLDDSSTVAFVYYAKIPALTASATTNWLLASHPDAYLWGGLAEAAKLGVDDDRLGIWKGQRDEILDEIIRLTEAARGTSEQQVDGPTP